MHNCIMMFTLLACISVAMKSQIESFTERFHLQALFHWFFLRNCWESHTNSGSDPIFTFLQFQYALLYRVVTVVVAKLTLTDAILFETVPFCHQLNRYNTDFLFIILCLRIVSYYTRHIKYLFTYLLI